MSWENEIITFKNANGDEWVGEPFFDPGYEFSCVHCGAEMERNEGYWRDDDGYLKYDRLKEDTIYCLDCAWDLFDQPMPITAYETELKKRRAYLSNILALRESARLEERECMYEEEYDVSISSLIEISRLTCKYTVQEERDLRFDYDALLLRERARKIEEQEEHNEAQRRKEEEAELKKRRASLSNILAKQESARLKERELKLEEEKECERMYEEDYDVFISDFIESTRLTCKYTGPEERDPRFDYDALMK